MNQATTAEWTNPNLFPIEAGAWKVRSRSHPTAFHTVRDTRIGRRCSCPATVARCQHIKDVEQMIEFGRMTNEPAPAVIDAPDEDPWAYEIIEHPAYSDPDYLAECEREWAERQTQETEGDREAWKHYRIPALSSDVFAAAPMAIACRGCGYRLVIEPGGSLYCGGCTAVMGAPVPAMPVLPLIEGSCLWSDETPFQVWASSLRMFFTDEAA